MLGFWGFEYAPWRAGQHLDDLPDPPAHTYAGFLLAVERVDQVHAVTAWAEAMRATRPGLAIGLVVADRGALRLAVIKARMKWTLTVGKEEFTDSVPPAEVIAPLLAQTLPHRTLEAWEHLHGEAGDERELLLELAELSAAGRGVDSVAKHLKLSRASLYRRLAGVGYPPPGLLLRQGRVAAYELRVARGINRREALHLGGWWSAGARDKVMQTLGADRIEFG